MTNVALINTNYQVIGAKLVSKPLATSYWASWASFYPASKAAYSLSDDPNWFIADYWMAHEREADEDIENGRFDTVNTVEELLAFFDAQEKEIQENG